VGWRGTVARLAFVVGVFVGFFATGFLLDAALKHRVSPGWWWSQAITVVALFAGTVVGYVLRAGVLRLTRRSEPEGG
jgi:hypothetical protein